MAFWKMRVGEVAGVAYQRDGRNGDHVALYPDAEGPVVIPRDKLIVWARFLLERHEMFEDAEPYDFLCPRCGATLNYPYCPPCGQFLDKARPPS